MLYVTETYAYANLLHHRLLRNGEEEEVTTILRYFYGGVGLTHQMQFNYSPREYFLAGRSLLRISRKRKAAPSDTL